MMPPKKRTLSDKDLEAFIDDELAPERRQEIIELINDDPDLLRRLAEYAQLNDSLSRLYKTVLDEPIPPRLIKIVEDYLPDDEP